MSKKFQDIMARIKGSVSSAPDLDRSIQAAKRVQSKRMQALELFRPFSYQDEFLFCTSTEVLIRGGTRSGKSTVIAAALASYLTGNPIYTSQGVKVYMREAEYRDKPTGEVWVIGKQMNHSPTIYRLLFQPGAFQIVRDPKTQQWRAWQPGLIKGDENIPKKDRKPAPPFIYPGDVKFGWERALKREWDTAELPNGWVLKYYPSNGAPKRGDPVHRIWIDEEIENDVDLYPELQSRLSDFAGRIWWSSWPALNCPALVELHERALADMADWRAGLIEKPDVYDIKFIGSANPVIDEEEKRKRRKGWDQATALARDAGEFNRESILTYPEFNAQYHTVDYGEDHPKEDKLARCLRANNFIPPQDWCVYLILDPGTRRPALLWVAIPPEEFWYQGRPFYIPYNELTGRMHAGIMAHRAKMMEPRRVYQRFVIDAKMGDQTPPGAVEQVKSAYTRAFKHEGLRSVETSSRFQPGETAWIVRSMALREMMLPVAPGAEWPALRVVSHKCPQLVSQIRRNIRQVSKHDIQDKRASGQVDDLLDSLEYFAGCHPAYAPPPPPPPEETTGFRAWKQEEELWKGFTGGRSDEDRKVVLGVP
jgi:hypothetical protein